MRSFSKQELKEVDPEDINMSRAKNIEFIGDKDEIILVPLSKRVLTPTNN